MVLNALQSFDFVENDDVYDLIVKLLVQCTSAPQHIITRFPTFRTTSLLLAYLVFSQLLRWPRLPLPQNTPPSPLSTLTSLHNLLHSHHHRSQPRPLSPP